MCCFIFHQEGVPIKNSPLEKVLYFYNGSSYFSQTFRLYMPVFVQHILQILFETTAMVQQIQQFKLSSLLF